MLKAAGLISAALAVGFGGTASAAEVWGGVFAHDITFVGEALGLGAAGKEDGFDVQVGARAEPLSALANARPYVIASINSEGDTSFAGAGLAWRKHFGGGRWYVQPGIGLVWHTGVDELPPFDEANITEAERLRRANLRQTENEYGSKVLFEPELSLGYRFNDTWAGELSYTHLSNGQILGKGQNDGLDTVGARVVYRFGGR